MSAAGPEEDRQRGRSQARLRRVAGERLVVLQGDCRKLAEFVEGGGWHGSLEAVVLVRPGLQGVEYLLFDRNSLARLRSWKDWQAEDPGILAAAARQVETVDPAARPEVPAIVVDDTEVIAVWLNRPSGVVKRILPASVSGVLRGRLPRRARRRRTGYGREWSSEWDSSPVPPDEVFVHRDGIPAESYPGTRILDGSQPLEYGAQPAAPGELLLRTPHLEVLHEVKLSPGQSFAIEVWCDEYTAHQGEESTAVEIDAPSEQDRFELSMWMACSEHVIFECPLASLEVRRSQPTSARVRLEGRVVAQPLSGPARISAMFVYEGRPCGSVTRSLAIEHGAEDQDVPPLGSDARMIVEPGAHKPDLLIEVKATDVEHRRFKCRFTTPLLPGREQQEPEDWHLPVQASEMVTNYMEAFAAEGLTAAQRISRLRGAGIKLFEAAPPGFKQLIWELFESPNKPSSILVVSDDWAIPWELMVPNRLRQGGGLEQREPLGVECSIGRWVTKDHVSPRQSLTLEESRTFAPVYEPPLDHAEDEVALVQRHISGARIEPGSYEALAGCMGATKLDLLHLACHGEASCNGAQAIKLESSSLFSYELPAMEGLARAVRAGHPLVFLNACEVGRPQPALVGVGGFATEFIDLGAGAVLAPLWSVADKFAHQVAEEFYEGIKAPSRPLAEIVSRIRAKAYRADQADDLLATGALSDSHDAAIDTFAAYCFYGDPLAAVGSIGLPPLRVQSRASTGGASSSSTAPSGGSSSTISPNSEGSR